VDLKTDLKNRLRRLASDQLLCRMGVKHCLLTMKDLKVEKVRKQGF